MSRKQFGQLWLVLGAFVSVATWLYVQAILEPWANAKDHENGIQVQMWDLYPRWLGARELLLHKRNPYGPEVTREIQMAFYGHSFSPQGSAASQPFDEQRFAYPVYVVFLMAPTVNMDFATVESWAPTVLGIFAVCAVLFSLGLLDWHPAWTTKIAITLFVLSSPQIVQGMRHQQLALVVACLLAAAGWFVHRGQLGAAGALLAFSTIKPQMALLPLLWFLTWTLGERRSRWRLFAVFGATIAILAGAGELLLPGWVRDFVDAMYAYRRYFPTTSFLRLFLGDRIGYLLSFFIVAALLIFGWWNRKVKGNSEQFTLALAIFLMADILVFPLLTPFNQALLILPALLLVRDWQQLPKASRIIFASIVAWPWVTSVLLLVLRRPFSLASHLPLLPAMAGNIVPLLLPVLLYIRRKSTTYSGASTSLQES